MLVGAGFGGDDFCNSCHNGSLLDSLTATLTCLGWRKQLPMTAVTLLSRHGCTHSTYLRRAT
jgi:hypothetical protein